MDNEALHAENNASYDSGNSGQPAPASGNETQATPSTGAGNSGSEDRAMEDAYAKAMGKRGIRTEPEHEAQDGGSEGQGTSAQPGGGSGPSPTNSVPSAGRGARQGEPGGRGNTGSPDGDAERRAWNRQQAAMRIARKQERQRLYQEELDRLSREKEAFEQEGESQNPTMAQVKDDQIRELNIQMVRELQQEWQREAYEMFTPDDAKQFLEDSQKYADWINKNEPELGKYINRPYGRYLLKGWFDKVAKNPELADRWESMNPYQKYQMLEKHYRELEKFGEDYAAGRVQIGVQGQQQNQTSDGVQQPGQQTQPPQPKDVPVPGSGRNTDTEPPGDNIDLLIDRAMQKRKAALHR